MKLLSLIAFLSLTKGIKVANCYLDETEYLIDIELKLDEPLLISDSYKELFIERATGSIGVKTFSQLHHLESLKIGDSSIEHIEDGALCLIPSLKELIITNQRQFPALTSSILSNCDKITSFSVGGIQMLPNALKPLSNVKSVDIVYQNITHLTKEYLEPLENINFVKFVRCNIDQIDDGSFCSSPKLRMLDLNGIKVSTTLRKGVFENCNTVTDFTYIHNDETDIEEEVFTGFTNVHNAHLNSLEINTLTKGYLSGLTSVENLRIGESKFTKIFSDAFEGFNNLKTLLLPSGQLSEIETGAFSALPNLDHLDLTLNKLTSIDNISNPKLRKVYASKNLISKIDGVAVKKNLPNLEYLELYENQVSPQDQAELKQVLEGKIDFVDTRNYRVVDGHPKHRNQ